MLDELQTFLIETLYLIGRNLKTNFQEAKMGKYIIAWLLGVPAFVLVIIYLLNL